MKGLSVVFTIVLLVLAHQLATHLKQAGALPAVHQPGPNTLVATPKTGHAMTPDATLEL